MLKFIQELFATVPEDQYMELRGITVQPPMHAKTRFYKKSEINELIADAELYDMSGTFHTCIGLLPRAKKSGSDADIKFIQTLWVDVDAKDFSNSKEKALAAVRSFPIKPSIIVDSGNGYHAYWLFDKAYKITGDRRFELLSKKVHKAIDADHTHNLSRVLRMPGTRNLKDMSDVKHCTIIENNHIRYSAETIEEAVKDVDVEVKNTEHFKKLNIDGVTKFKTLHDLGLFVSRGILERARKIPKYLFGDRSKNDLFVASCLYELGFTDKEVLKAFKLFADAGWDAGEKFKITPDYLFKHTLPHAKEVSESIYDIIEDLKTVEDEATRDVLVRKGARIIANGHHDHLKNRLQAVTKMPAKEFLPLINNEMQGRGKHLFEEVVNGKTLSFSPARLAQTIMEEKQFLNVGGMLFMYESGVFVLDVEEASLRLLVRGILDTQSTSHKVKEVVDHIKETSERIELADHTPDPRYINVQNGMLNIHTKELLPHDPAYKSLTQLNIKYNAKAKCPRLHTFVKETFETDDQNTFQEFFGYVLSPRTDLKKFAILVGGGDNGKSVALNIITSLLGHKFVSHEPLQSLANERFSSINLLGKSANISADLSASEIKNIGIIKQLTGRDEVVGEQKFCGRVTFKNNAKLIFACNVLPQASAADDAYFNRLLIFNCPNIVPKHLQDPHLEETLTSEEARSAWLNYGLEGLNRLIDQGKLTPSVSIDRMLLNHRTEASPANVFVEKFLEYEDGGKVKVVVLQQALKLWCKNMDVQVPSSKALTLAIRKHIPQADRRSTTTGYVYFNSKFADDLDLASMSMRSDIDIDLDIVM